MDSTAVEKAKDRLRRAKESLAQISVPGQQKFERLADHWSTFLIALNGVYAALEQGAKSSPQSRQWFGMKKNERRKDPLLQYLHQARNADEHGIAPVTKMTPLNVRHLSGDPLTELIVEEDRLRIGVGKDQTATVRVYVPTFILTTVSDTRFGDSFEPPTHHMGKPVEHTKSPPSVGALALAYAEALVLEAEAIAKKTS